MGRGPVSVSTDWQEQQFLHLPWAVRASPGPFLLSTARAGQACGQHYHLGHCYSKATQALSTFQNCGSAPWGRREQRTLAVRENIVRGWPGRTGRAWAPGHLHCPGPAITLLVFLSREASAVSSVRWECPLPCPPPRVIVSNSNVPQHWRE